MTRTTSACALRLAALSGLALLSLPSWAHHPMGGAVPATLWQGLLSGLAHPVIGLDHLAFLLAAGLAAAWAGLRGIGPLCVFALAATTATALRLSGVPPALAEAGVAVTLLVLAGMLLSRRTPGLPAAVGLAVAAGLLHGHAFAEAAIGAEATPLLGYLAGLAVVQALVLVLAWRLGARVKREHPGGLQRARRVAAGVLAAAAGAAMAGALAV